MARKTIRIDEIQSIPCRKEKELSKMEANIEIIGKKVDEMHKHIIGNGRPGLLERVSNNETKFTILYAVISVTLIALSTVAVFAFR